MKFILLLTMLLAGADKPMQKLEEQPNMEACEAAAHKFNVTTIPDEVRLASAACLRIRPQPAGDPT